MENRSPGPLANLQDLARSRNDAVNRQGKRYNWVGCGKEQMHGHRRTVERQVSVPVRISARVLNIREVKQEEFSPAHSSPALGQVLCVVVL